MTVTILVDNVDSWFCEYANNLEIQLKKDGHIVHYIHDANEVCEGDILFLLSCTKLVKNDVLKKNKHNIVIHASDLPKGKGFTPLKWQILEGKNDIPLTLFEAVEEMDAGDYYIKDYVHFEGYELLEELHNKLGNKVCEMAQKYVQVCGQLRGIKQTGRESVYPKRKKSDDKIDITRSLESQFNLFRIADNERYPLWFSYMGHEYVIEIKERKE